MTARPRQFVCVVWLIAVAFGSQGCAMLNTLAGPPVDDSHMSHAIAAIVPIGTPRAEVLRRLKAAGIAGEFLQFATMLDRVPTQVPHDPALDDTLYFAESWKRPNGEDWLIDVQLSFDAAGRLERISSSSRFGNVPPTTRLVRRRWRPDGVVQFVGLGNDADVPRLLHQTAGNSNAPGSAFVPHIAIGISDSPDALNKMMK